MITLSELLAKKAKFEKEKLFIEAKISVVNEMIEDEEKDVEKVEETETQLEIPTDESY